MHPSQWTRRRFLAASGTIASTALFAACANHNANHNRPQVRPILPDDRSVADAEARRRRPGATVRRTTLAAAPATVEIGSGTPRRTWAYGRQVPGRELRFTRGDIAQIHLRNDLPEATTAHWHGLALRNDMDGVPDLTQTHVQPGTGFDYEFAVPDPGTYWFHPHSGLQLDRGLYAPFIVEDPAESAAYDDEVVLMLDDWTDDIGPSPDQILTALRSQPVGMDHEMTLNNAAMSEADDPDRPLGTDGGDVDYPLHLINGKGPDNPAVIRARPGQRLRLRIINAAADTAYRFTISGHRLTVTHTDGFPVEPTETDAVLITMGERYDAIITTGDGVFEILARPESKSGAGRALLRTASGPPQPAAEHRTRRPLTAADLTSLESVRLPAREPDTNVNLELSLAMDRYEWPINGRAYPDHEPINVRVAQRVRIRIDNQSPMFHPMHLHGHTFEVEHPDGRRLRKDTIAVAPMQSTTFAVECNNPGQWALHCHNGYHAEAGMMTVLSYRS